MKSLFIGLAMAVATCLLMPLLAIVWAIQQVDMWGDE
jgi:hypothetical protein